MPVDITNNKLRALAGLILLILAVIFLICGANNSTLETIMLALVAFLVGGALFNALPIKK